MVKRNIDILLTNYSIMQGINENDETLPHLIKHNMERPNTLFSEEFANQLLIAMLFQAKIGSMLKLIPNQMKNY